MKFDQKQNNKWVTKTKKCSTLYKQYLREEENLKNKQYGKEQNLKTNQTISNKPRTYDFTFAYMIASVMKDLENNSCKLSRLYNLIYEKYCLRLKNHKTWKVITITYLITYENSQTYRAVLDRFLLLILLLANLLLMAPKNCGNFMLKIST